MTLDEKLDEALKDTFPASDAFSLTPDPVLMAPQTTEEVPLTKCDEPTTDRSS